MSRRIRGTTDDGIPIASYAIRARRAIKRDYNLIYSPWVRKRAVISYSSSFFFFFLRKKLFFFSSNRRDLLGGGGGGGARSSTIRGGG